MAAISPEGDEFVIVLLNVEEEAFDAKINLATFKKIAPVAKVYRTPKSENCKELESVAIKGKRLSYKAEPMSITTIVVKVK